jgi:molybdopterin/thiamine biosynthesis adenylyltransferase
VTEPADIHARLAQRLGSERLAALQRKRAAVIGVGLLGGVVVHQLAMARVPMRLVDCGEVEAPNLGNSLLPAAALGLPKVQARAAQVRAIDPECPVEVLEARVEALGLGDFEGCDVLVTGLDGRSSRLAVNRIAQRLGIDWIDAGVEGSGEHLLGTVSYFRPFLDDHACGGCRYLASDLAAIGREGRGAGCPSWREEARPVTAPTLAAAPFGAVIAGFQALFAICALLGEGDALVNRALQISASELPRARMVELARGAECAFPHARIVPLRRVGCATLAELLDAAARDLGGSIEESDVAQLIVDPFRGDPPRVFHGVLRQVEHFERQTDGTARRRSTPIFFSIELPEDYCSCLDGSLQLRVARVHVPLFHPNVSASGIVCLGPRFQPSTRARALLEHLYAISASRGFASQSPWDRETGTFYRDHAEEVRKLRAPPLWRSPVAARARVEALPPRGGRTSG